ncbi:MFS transporter [Guggenheimella bovis]
MKKLPKNLLFFFIAALSLGLGQAFLSLFLNFYLTEMGMSQTLVGVVNASPAIIGALLSIPTVLFTRRFGDLVTLRVGFLLLVIGSGLMAIASNAPVALVSNMITGIGGVLIGVSSAPYLSVLTTEENRTKIFSIQAALGVGVGFLGNMIGGFIPKWYGSLIQIDAKSLEALRSAMFVSFIVQVLGCIFVFFLTQHEKHEKKPFRLTVENKKLMAHLLIPSVIVGLGAGMVVPFINLFIEAKFKVSFEELGAIFAWTSLATMLTVLIQPALVKRFGHVKSMVIVQALSLPFLAILGYSPLLWLVIIALFTRGALMNAANPVLSAFAMNHLSVNDRPMFSALNMICWNGAWALSATASGWFRSMMGKERVVEAFHYLFAWTLVMYIIYTVLTYVLLIAYEKRES